MFKGIRFLSALAVLMLTITPLLNAQPTVEWSNVYGDSELNWVGDVFRDSNANFLFSGNYPFAEVDSMWGVKVDSQGNLLWQGSHEFEYPDGFDDAEFEFTGFLEDDAGGYRVFLQRYNEGFEFNELISYHISSDGEWGDLEIIFDSNFANDPWLTIIRKTESGYLVVGDASNAASGTQAPSWLIKLDSDMNISWSESLTIGDYSSISTRDVIVLPDGGYLLTGKSYVDDSNDSDILFIEVDSQGQLVSYQAYGSSDMIESPQSIAETNDGGFVIVGSIEDLDEEFSSVYVVKTDSNGNAVWEESYDGPQNSSRGGQVIEDWGNEFTIIGSTMPAEGEMTDSDVLVFKIDSDGNQIWSTTFGDAGNLEISMGVFPSWDNSIYIAGMKGNIDNINAWLMKTTDDVLEVETAGNLPSSPLLINAYPNPFNNQTRVSVTLAQSGIVEISVFDILGREISNLYKGQVQSGTQNFYFNGSGLGSGTYFVKVNTANGQFRSRRLTLIK